MNAVTITYSPLVWRVETKGEKECQEVAPFWTLWLVFPSLVAILQLQLIYFFKKKSKLWKCFSRHLTLIAVWRFFTLAVPLYLIFLWLFCKQLCSSDILLCPLNWSIFFSLSFSVSSLQVMPFKSVSCCIFLLSLLLL